ncbi:hypothetical protein P872_20580 [Rhodonellum psychrophilum GCM71 = DSM 17998]|uniref:Uncharacterized protein n=1 Tax=Rhodonellum psychrophilum GCM71 = DSM 17998 TaxID=1123057 RepID=U5BYX9_9BACT|nr:hypothetical protein P872_20580 [Rhodonellum psychrophilum GCM71 = DSM 17998]
MQIIDFGVIKIESTVLNKGVGEQFKPIKEAPFQPVLFSELELEILKTVAHTFRTCSTQEIILKSHNEDA